MEPKPTWAVVRVDFSVGLGRGLSRNISPSRAYYGNSACARKVRELLLLAILSSLHLVSTEPDIASLTLQREMAGSLLITSSTCGGNPDCLPPQPAPFPLQRAAPEAAQPPPLTRNPNNSNNTRQLCH